MTDLPPFAPPYQPLSPEFARAMAEHQTSASSATPATAPRSTGAKEGVVYLVVPFAEKDEAKSLGARWDAAARKWYIAADKERAAFQRWLPKT